MERMSTKNEQKPALSIQDELAALDTMNLPALRKRYFEVFKEPTSSHNGPYLRKRIAWRIQELAEGGLSERAKRRIRELAADAPLRRRGPRTSAAVASINAPATPRPGDTPACTATRDPRLPPAGTRLRKKFNGREHVVIVNDDGFLYGQERFRSLSRIAHVITGTTWNGFAFFGLTDAWRDAL